LKLPFMAGSDDSKKMLSVLNRQKESEVYETNFIRSFLEYKWTKVCYLGYFLMLVHFGYLINLALDDSWIVVLVWFIYFLVIFLYKLATSGQDESDWWENLEIWASSAWNWTDLITILSMITVLILSAFDESWIILRRQMFAVLTLISWIGFI
jgi:hypothetical protein